MPFNAGKDFFDPVTHRLVRSGQFYDGPDCQEIHTSTADEEKLEELIDADVKREIEAGSSPDVKPETPTKEAK